MADTALKFGPDWLRALANAPSSSTSPPSTTSQPPTANATAAPKYSLAKYRYGREEMLALMPKNPKMPDCLKKDTSKVVRETFQQPLALTPVTEDEQRLMSRCVNSDAVLRASGKSVPGNMGRGGRGGSVDRGRGRGRGGYYQRGLASYDHDSEDIPPFSRPKPVERSLSASEKDQRWDDRDRRFDRSYSGRGSGFDDSAKMDPARNSHSQEYWRRYDKDDESDWRSSGPRSDKSGPRGSWRNPVDKDRREVERNPSHNLNGNRGSQSHQKVPGPHLPEWSIEDANEQDVVGTFDSSGAFLETKVSHDNSEDIYISDEADEESSKDSPGDKRPSPGQKTPQKPRSPPRGSSSNKQTPVKPASSPSKPENFPPEKQPPEPPAISPPKNPAVDKSASIVIKSCNNSPEQYSVNSQKQDSVSVTLPIVPNSTARAVQENFVALSRPIAGCESPGPNAGGEEDTFAHHKKATENMVAQWTEEEEQKEISHAVPPVHDTDPSWFYKDPQGQIQGPFESAEMLEWFTSGYFTMSLMVRRNSEDVFCQLGDLIKSYGRVPFLPNSSPPPPKATPLTTSLPTPPSPTIVPNPVAAPVGNPFPKPDEQLLALQQQLLQHQIMQQQLLLRQAQLQQLFAQLKQQENFSSLNTQQQQQVLMQQFMSQQQLPRPNIPGLADQPNPLEAMAGLPLPLLGLPMAPLLKNDLSLWNLPPTASPWPLNIPVSQPSATPTGSIWDIEPPKPAPDETELEKHKRLTEEQEKHRKAEEDRLAQEKEMEEKRRIEQKRREEERLLQELKKQEEEKHRIEELRRMEEEKLRLEELRQREERRRQEEELRRIEEQKRLEELKKQEEELKRLEELKRQEEKRLEEHRKQEEKKRMEELKFKEEMRLEEERKKLEKELEEKRKRDELQKKLEMERERERIELEKQKMLAKMKELEAQRELQRQREKEEEMRRLAEIKLRSQGPAWGVQNAQAESQLSLADIQKLQEEKERQEREERERIRLQQLQQQATKQTQQNKNGLSWAKSFYTSAETNSAVKSLAEIQQEEAERLAMQQKTQKPPAPAPVVSTNVGVWGNSSQLTRITAALPGWSSNSLASAGFWDDALSSTQAKKQPAKSNDSSAFPALTNHSDKPGSNQVQSNKSKNVRAKKEEDAVKKLFSNHKPTDEFTAWCTEALSAMPSSVDVPTFVAFLKDIESPYEVHDYVKSYLGDGKEPREFAKQFLEKRSKFKARQNAIEDNTLWGPAPAVNPVVNKTSLQSGTDNDGNSNSKGKSKRRKNRMQKLDNSMLGFTVQPNPDRLNVGEIEHLDM